MCKLLYDDGEGRTHEVSRLVWEQLISDVRDELVRPDMIKKALDGLSAGKV